MRRAGRVALWVSLSELDTRKDRETERGREREFGDEKDDGSGECWLQRRHCSRVLTLIDAFMLKRAEKNSRNPSPRDGNESPRLDLTI